MTDDGTTADTDVAFDRPGDGILRVTLNRPAVHNAISLGMQRSIDAHLATAAADDDIRVVVLAGAGPRAFSAGYDLTEMAAMSDDALAATISERDEMLWRYFTFPKPTVAAISGLSYGAGTLYAACSDLRVGGAATSMSVTAAKYGGANLTWLLGDIIGMGHARDMLLTSRVLTGRDALAAGLITRYADDGDVDAAALTAAGELAAQPLPALLEIKRLLNDGPGHTARLRFDRETEVGRTTLRPTSVTSTFTAFFEKSTR